MQPLAGRAPGAPAPAGLARGPASLQRASALRERGARQRSGGPWPGRCGAAATEESLRALVAADVPTAATELPAPGAGKLAARATAYVEELRIRSYEVDPKQRATVVTIANLLQEVAGNHAVLLWGRSDTGFALDPVMVQQSLIFVATRIQIQMDRFPKWGDMVSIETWFQPDGRVAACRNWVIRDLASGQPLGRATSTWFMLNWTTRKLAKYPDSMREKMNYLAPNPPRHSVDPAQAKIKIPPLEGPFEITGPVQVARRSDMDMNGHINNVTYLAWALETVPVEVYASYRLLQVETDYKAECMAGDRIECVANRVREDSNGSGVVRFVHLIQRCDDKGCVELVRARTTWQPGPANDAGMGASALQQQQGAH